MMREKALAAKKTHPSTPYLIAVERRAFNSL